MKKIIQVPKEEVTCDFCGDNVVNAPCECMVCNKDACGLCRDEQAGIFLYDGMICKDCLNKLPVIPKEAYENLTDISAEDVKPFISASMDDYIVMLRGEWEFQLDICKTIEQCNKSLGDFATDYHIDGYETTMQLFHNGQEYEYTLKTCGFISDNDDGTVTTRNFDGSNKETRKIKGR